MCCGHVPPRRAADARRPVGAGFSRLSGATTRAARSAVSALFRDARRCIREVIEVVYPQLFEKLGEKFKKYERFNSYTGNLLSFNAF